LVLALAAGCEKEAQGPAPSTAQPATVTSGAPAAPAAANASPASAGELAVGSPAPAFDLKGHTGAPLRLASLKGRPVVLYFYPKDETPGCTTEACAFRDGFAELTKRGVVLIGVSADTDESHRNFATSHKLPFQLVSDAKGDLSKAYGVPFNNGFISRHTIVIGPDGNIKKLYRTVNVANHAAEILRDVEGMTPPAPPPG
jgi:peroxiredoxin Q/BCP